MLGLADRGRIFDLLELLLSGTVGEALAAFAGLHRDGAEPGQILADLAEAVHVTTRAKTLGAAGAGDGLSGEERRRATALAERLSVAILARAWQLLLKGLESSPPRPTRRLQPRWCSSVWPTPPTCRRPPTSSMRWVAALARRRQAAADNRGPLDGQRPGRHAGRGRTTMIAWSRTTPRYPRHRRWRCRSCASFADVLALAASAARPSSRCTWRST